MPLFGRNSDTALSTTLAPYMQGLPGCGTLRQQWRALGYPRGACQIIVASGLKHDLCACHILTFSSSPSLIRSMFNQIFYSFKAAPIMQPTDLFYSQHLSVSQG